jgi:hypothetical protein
MINLLQQSVLVVGRNRRVLFFSGRVIAWGGDTLTPVRAAGAFFFVSCASQSCQNDVQCAKTNYMGSTHMRLQMYLELEAALSVAFLSRRHGMRRHHILIAASASHILQFGFGNQGRETILPPGASVLGNVLMNLLWSTIEPSCMYMRDQSPTLWCRGTGMHRFRSFICPR